MFGENLRFCREYLKLTQSGIADKIGVKQSVIARYEKDESTPSVEVASRIAKTIGVSLDLLMEERISDKDLALETILVHIKSTVKSKGLTLGKIESLKVIATLLDKGL
ncbi:MAG: helix-turn-helix transcriptional regulator [Cyclobacteriaceae bacterium]